MANDKSLQFSYDEAEDVLTIEGIRYSGGVFRHLGFDPVGSYFQLLCRNTVLTLRGPLKLTTTTIKSGASGKSRRPHAIAVEAPHGTP